jgi:hypothetical protein
VLLCLRTCRLRLVLIYLFPIATLKLFVLFGLDWKAALARYPVGGYLVSCSHPGYSYHGQTIIFCERSGEFSDILYDSGGEVEFPSKDRSAAWWSAFQALAEGETRSEAYQLNKLMSLSAADIRAEKIAPGLYIVRYDWRTNF